MSEKCVRLVLKKCPQSKERKCERTMMRGGRTTSFFSLRNGFWLLSRGVVIAPRRRRRRARVSIIAREAHRPWEMFSWSFACLNRFLSFLYLRREQQFLVVFFVSTSEKMTDLFLFLFLCVFYYSLSLPSKQAADETDNFPSQMRASTKKSGITLPGRFT